MSEISTTERILNASCEIFLEKGFKDASIHNIASKSGISAAAIYRHFKDKETIFDALVAPAIQGHEKSYSDTKEVLLDKMTNISTDAMWEHNRNMFTSMVDQIYANYDAYKLLICCSAGTKYSDYIHTLAERMQHDTFYFMSVLRTKGVSVKEVDPVEFHLIISAEYSAFFEIVQHDFNYDQAKHYAQILDAFFQPNWRKLLGF